MDGFSKFGIYLICMLALVLVAVTPDTAWSIGVGNSVTETVPANLPALERSVLPAAFAVT